MAITADQSALLQMTVDNLNRSIEINNQVLELMKSIGNTGIVDIATHNTNLSAHPAFNNVIALQGIRSSPYTNGETTEGNLGGNRIYASLQSSIQQLVNRWNAYGAWGTGGATGSVNLINGYGRNSDGSATFSGKTVISINGYGWSVNDGSNTFSLLSSIGLGQDADSNGFCQIGLNDSTYGNASLYRFEYARFLGQRNADLGSSTYQWKDCYLQNSPIVSSDERLKQDIADVPEAVFRAWGHVGFKQYRFKEVVEKKGADARLHVGLIAQKILEAFEAEGLDATKYGIVCHDEWDDQYVTETITDAEAVLDEKGNVVTPEKTHQEKRFVKAAGDLWTVRYEEALALETAYQRWRLSKIEAALAAKGITL